MGWAPTVWVHWVVAHSGYFLQLYHNLAQFSSVPTERRHQGFKRDLRYSFQGWKISQPSLSNKALAHVLSLDALDKGLQLMGHGPAKKARLA